MFKNTLMVSLIIATLCRANGVPIVDAVRPAYLNLLESTVQVSIENQVAITKTTQIFLNDFGNKKTFKYAFHIAEQASAISLRWEINKQWFSADVNEQLLQVS